MEGAWRGLHHLWTRIREDSLDAREGGAGDNADAEIRVLNVTKSELLKDSRRAPDYDRTVLFEKVYSEGLDSPAEPPEVFALLIGDYEFSYHPEDVELLEHISGVAAAAFAPFVASASPRMFGLQDFGELEFDIRLDSVQTEVAAQSWRSFRKSEDARYVGLTVPRIALRAPYSESWQETPRLRCPCDTDLSHVKGRMCPECGHEFRLGDPDTYRKESVGFHFREVFEPGQSTRRRFLFGNAAFAFGAVVARSHIYSGWLVDIRGTRRVEIDTEGNDELECRGGLVDGLPEFDFTTDSPGVARRIVTDVVISDEKERYLGELGFLALCACRGTSYAAFYGNPSVQEPKDYGRDDAATVNARISSMLQYVLCTSRFAHCLKATARGLVGSFSDPASLQTKLERWINEFVEAAPDPNEDAKAERPLFDARVNVKESLMHPGRYECVLHLEPHPQLDSVSASIKLTTELMTAEV